MTAMSLDKAVRHVTSTNPAFAVATRRIRGVDYAVFANAPDSIRDMALASFPAHDDGAATYLVFNDERWTFDQFMTETKALANVLHERFGVGKGTRVAMASRNAPEYLTLILAISALGAVVVFLNAWWTTEELDYALDDTGATLVFADAQRIERLDPLRADRGLVLVGLRDGEAVAEHGYSRLLAAARKGDWPAVAIDPEDDFAIMYSSGTTSHPKGVVLTHRGAVNAVYTWAMQAALAPLVAPPSEDAPPAPRPACLVVTPLFHITATHPVFLLSIAAGAKLALMDKWDSDQAVRIIRDEKITRFLGVPTQTADLLAAAERSGERLESLDYLGSGGAKRPPSQVAELARRFPNAQVATGWGMTETNANGIGMAGPDYEARPGSAGRLYPPVQELRILGPDGRDLPAGEVGEITVKSPCNMRCYLNKPEATAEVLRDGWLRTGDLGLRDGEGYVTIVDRKKNIIIRGGENIACLDVEAALHRHPAVAEACVFALPHDRLGEVPGAAVQLRPGHAAGSEELNAFLADHIARFKMPQRYWFVDAPLPRGATGKIDRRGLRATCLAELTEDSKEGHADVSV